MNGTYAMSTCPKISNTISTLIFLFKQLEGVAKNSSANLPDWIDLGRKDYHQILKGSCLFCQADQIQAHVQVSSAFHICSDNAKSLQNKLKEKDTRLFLSNIELSLALSTKELGSKGSRFFYSPRRNLAPVYSKEKWNGSCCIHWDSCPPPRQIRHNWLIIFTQAHLAN